LCQALVYAESQLDVDTGIETAIGRIGFRVDTAESVGNKVYPGFSSYNLKWKSVINAVRIRVIVSDWLLRLYPGS
jgi:hypothetical protein